MDYILSTIRDILSTSGNLSTGVEEIGMGDDLFALGLSSFQSVQLMMAIEERFDLQFPDAMIRKETFQSIGAMVRAVDFILGEASAGERAVG